MRFEVVALLPLAAATLFPEASQYDTRSLDQYDDEVFEILARDLAFEEDFLEAREAEARRRPIGWKGFGQPRPVGPVKKHRKPKHRKGRHGRHGHHGHHRPQGIVNGLAEVAGTAAGAAAGTAGAAPQAAGGAPEQQAPEQQAPAPARRSDEDLETMLYIRDLLDAYGDFDAEGLDMY